jgi:beta-galactosidase
LVVSQLLAAALLFSVAPANAAFSSVNAVEVTWAGDEWDANTVYAINREDPHASFFPYASEADAKEYHNYHPEESPYYQTLNGTWKFNHVERPADRPMENGADSFETVDFDDSGWDNIQVPGNWQVNWNEDGTFKYDQIIYVNSAVTWNRAEYGNGTVTYPRAPKNFNPVGTYRRTFTINPAWGDRAVFLSLDGVESNCYIWVNGYRVGYAEDSYTGKTFDITPFIHYTGENVIAIQVFRWSAGSWFENQDMIRLSGIFRDIYLTSHAKVALYDAEVKTTPVTAGKYDGDWDLNIKALLRDLGADNAMKNGSRLSATLYDKDDKSVGSVVFDEPLYTTRKNMLDNDYIGADLEANIVVAAPELWSAEHPNLYKLVLSLKNGGNLLETTCIRVGFRQVEAVNLGSRQDARMLINGTRILLYGTNLHESNPDTGKHNDMEFIRREYELMKQNNINAVRMAHYPHARLYYDLADEYGLYIMDEANVENHGLSIPANQSARWVPALRDRENNMMERDMNYPSVIIWSLGNENSLSGPSGQPSPNQVLLEFVGAKDPSRLKHAQYANGTAAYSPELFSGFYGPAQSTSQSASGGWWQNTCSRERPTVLAEYAHAMGNSNGNMDSFIELCDVLPKAICGFIWEWADQGIWTPVPGNPDRKFLAFDGDWGDPRRDGNFCMDGMVTADRQLYPQMAEVKYSYRMVTATLKDSNTFTINNKYLFTNVDAYDMSWELKKNGEVVQSGSGVYDVSPAPAGVVPTVNVEPYPPNVTPGTNFQGSTMTSVDFPVPFAVPEDVDPGDEYFFNVSFATKEDTVWADAGHVVSESHMPIDFGQANRRIGSIDTGEFQIADNENTVGVSGEDFQVTVDKTNGEISAYRFKGRDLLAAGPSPNFWRAPIDNEYGQSSLLSSGYNTWRNVGRGRTTTSIDVTDAGHYAIVTVNGAFPTNNKNGVYTTVYKIYANGEVNVAYTFTFPALSGNARYVQEIGSMMTVKSDFENLTWFGRGPGESYTDRKWGNFVGLYESTVTDQNFPYSITQEMGNKVETRWLALTDDEGFGMVVKGDSLVEFNALHYSPEELGERRYKHFYEAAPMEDICLRVNLTSVGVGGNDSWGRIPLDQYRPMINNNTFQYGYTILPIEKFTNEEALAFGKTLKIDDTPVFKAQAADAADGVVVRSLEQADGKILRAQVEVTELTDDASEKTAILALYDAAGRLARVTTSEPLPLHRGDIKTVALDMDLTGLDAAGMCVKFFVWDTWTLTPATQEGALR